MRELDLEIVRRDGERLMEDLAREGYLAHAGLKTEADFQSIYARYSHLLSSDSLEFATELYRSHAPDTETARSARILLDWQIDSRVGHIVAAIDEREIAWEGSAMVQVDNGWMIPYQSATMEIANARDRGVRLALDEARAHVAAAEHMPLRLERLQREHDFVSSLGLGPDYNSTFERLSGMNLAHLRSACEQFLNDTQSMWGDLLPFFLRKVGVSVGDATRADALALFRAPEFDAAFPGSAMESSIRRQVSDMGIDPTARGRVIYDVEERQGKRSRAFCSPVRIPEEVYLVLRPHGGQVDYNTFLHELGHALHFAFMREDYPFEFRWLGDNSVTEGYAMLFDHRMRDRGWLLRYSEIGKTAVEDFLRTAAFEELHFLRRYAGKLIYETEVYAGTHAWSTLPDIYVEVLGRATSFRYNAADAFIDLDPGYYSTRYLRAWQLQAVIDEELTRRFDLDWHRNPKAGPWMVEELFSLAQRETAEELGTRLGAKDGLSFAPLVRSLEAALAS
jgi:hypothetical protein